MDIDIAQLASQIAPILIPYLVKGGEAFAGETGKKIAESLWEKFKPKVEAKESAKEAMQDVIDSPEDKGAAASFEHQIKKILAEDPRFAAEISIAIENVDISSIQAGDKSVIVGRDVNNSNVIIGKDNRVINATTYIEGNVYKGPAPRNPQDALKIYRAVMANMTSSLSMRGIDLRASDPSTQKTIGLANVYIDLDTTTPIKRTIKENQTAKTEDELGFGGVENDLLSALEAVIQNSSLVIKGDPGSGKSTFVNYMTNCLATQSTDRLAGWKREDSDILPIVVILRDFIRAFKKLPPQAEPRHIWDFIEKRLKDQNLSSSSKPIHEMLEQGKAIVFFDGLDEVSTIAQRVFIRDAVTTFTKRYPTNRYVVTCRILSYQPPKAQDEPDLRLISFPEFELAQFDEEKINLFIDAWYRESTSVGITTPELASDLNTGLKTAVQRVELRKLASNPLLLTVMAVVNTNDGQLPNARALLYKRTIEILLWQWEQASKGQEAHLRQLLHEADCAETDLEQVIWRLAYEAHAQTNKDDDEESLAGISELNLHKSLAAINKGDLNWAARVIETMKMRAGLLIERDNNVFTFPHRSFQEFLAGTFLESKDDFVSRAKELAKDQLLWRQTILWAVSRSVYIRGSNEGPLALVAELCPSGTPLDETGWSKVWLAGDILLEVGLNRVERSELGKDLLPRVQNRLKELIEQNRLAPRERAEAGDTLAKLSDPRVGVTNDFLFCEIPAGAFLMGNTKETDSMADDDEVPQFIYNKIKSNYYISRYPITNAQFDLFVNDPDGYANDQCYTDAGKKWRTETKQDRPPKQGGAFDLPNHPVVNVSWYEAVAFTRWLTNKLRNENAKLKIWGKEDIREVPIDFTKWEVRLPTEAEWEKAARWKPSPAGRGQGEGESLRYPWGNEITPNHANYSDTNIGSTSAVGTFPLGMSEYGLLDMSGNVWEWCATQRTEDYNNYDKNENNDLEGDVPRVLRGGAFFSDEGGVRCAFRYGLDPYLRDYYLGFRVVVSPFF